MEEPNIEGLELCVKLLQKYIKVLKKEEQDKTGLGLWRIFCMNFEQATKCKIVQDL